MSKKLVGSLTVAPAAPSPQELPPARRLAALYDRAATEGPDPRTAASILRSKLGSYVRPVDGVGFVATTMLKSGDRFLLNGYTQTGKLAQMVVKDAVQDFMPTWARRIASIALVAWEAQFDPMIKQIIRDYGLPVDESVNWDARLHDIFRAAGVKNEDQRRDAVMDSVLTILQRHLMERFDPTRGASRDGKETPLDKRVTAYLTQVFKWQATGKSEAGDKARRQQYDAGFSMDEPLGEEGEATLGDVLPGDYVDQEAEAHSESVVRSLGQFLDSFEEYLQKARGGNLSKTCITLLKLVLSAHDAAEVKARWPIETGTSYSNMRRILSIVAEELVNFSKTSKAPDIHLTRLINRLRQRLSEQAGPSTEPEPEPEPVAPVEDTEQVGTKAKEMQPKTSAATPIAVCASASDFMTKLAAYVSLMTKEAAPKVIEQSILYLRLGGNRANPRFMDISFYSPKLRTVPGAGSYKIEVGDWGQDKSLPERRIRQAVGTFVIPMMRGDVLEQDHDLLEKVIRRLRSIVWDNAVEYFQIPLDQKPEWRNVVKMDISRLLDTKVTIQDPDRGAIEIAASLTEGAHGRKAARKAAGGYPVEDDSVKGFHVVGSKRQIALQAAEDCPDCGAPNNGHWDPVQPRPKWNEEKQAWEPGDKTPGGLLGGQPTKYAGLPLHPMDIAEGLVVGLGTGIEEVIETIVNRVPNAMVALRHLLRPSAQLRQVLELCVEGKPVPPELKPVLDKAGEQGLWGATRGSASPDLSQKGKTVLKALRMVTGPKMAKAAAFMSRQELERLGKEAAGGLMDGPYRDGQKIVPPAKQARSLGGELNLTPAEQTDFAPDPDHMTTASDIRSLEDEARLAQVLRLFQQEGAWQHDGTVFHSVKNPQVTISHDDMMALMHLGLLAAPGAAPHGGLSPRGELFLSNHPQTLKEATVSTQKFAALKRLAAENPEAIAEAIDGIKSQLSEQINNLTIMQENLGIKKPVEDAEVKEGEPVAVQDVEGPEKFAGLKHLAAEEPALVEEAFGEFYLSLDKIMAQTEALADNLDITLPDAAPVDVEEEAAEEGETVPEEIAEGGSDTDDAPHGDQPAATEEPAPVE